MARRGSRASIVAMSALGAALSLVSVAASQETAGSVGEPSWVDDVAPIVYSHCVSCHRPGQAAPFSLLDYDQARARARQIAEVTGSGFMPPWRPDPESARFAGDRRLSTEQIETLALWARSGAPRGEGAVEAPHFDSGWQLGEPDLVVAMPQPYTLAPEGLDVFRNFTVPVSLDRPLAIRAVEVRFDNPALVHHATLLVAEHGVAQRHDALDDEVGFVGRVWAEDVFPPEGQIVAWTPGRGAQRLPEGTRWDLAAGHDLVLEAHLLPSGRPEPFSATVGLYFTDEPATRQTLILRLGSGEIDIPAGERDYRVEDRFTLPAPVELLTIYPHAHYLCRDVEASVRLPDGSSETLLRIADWDFNWQESYELAAPRRLPAGSEIVMRYVYDNSAANPANPNQPPRRVSWGPRSRDEMSELFLQVALENEDDERQTRGEIAAHWQDLARRGYAMRRRNDPQDVEARGALAAFAVRRGDAAEAAKLFAEVVALEPDNATALNNLGAAQLQLGDVEAAGESWRRALALEPASALFRTHLASAELARGRAAEGERLLREAVSMEPQLAQAQINLGTLLVESARAAEGLPHLDRAVALRPEAPQVHYDRGNALAALGRVEEALAAYDRALELDPRYPEAHHNRGAMLAAIGRLEEARAAIARALELRPDYADARTNLEAVDAALARRGR